MIVALEPENLFYMTGFWGEAIGILEKNGKTTIIAPELEVGRAKEEGVDCEVIQSDRGMSCLLYTSPSPRDKRQSRMPSSA